MVCRIIKYCLIAGSIFPLPAQAQRISAAGDVAAYVRIVSVTNEYCPAGRPTTGTAAKGAKPQIPDPPPGKVVVVENLHPTKSIRVNVGFDFIDYNGQRCNHGMAPPAGWRTIAGAKSGGFVITTAEYNSCMATTCAGDRFMGTFEVGAEWAPADFRNYEPATAAGSKPAGAESPVISNEPAAIPSVPYNKAAATALDLEMATSASLTTYMTAKDNGERTSAAIAQATMAGVPQINDTRVAAGYAAVGMSAAIIARYGEERAVQERERMEYINRIRAQVADGQPVFGFLNGATARYQVVSVIAEMKKNGRIKSVYRQNLYSVQVQHTTVTNDANNLIVVQVSRFRNEQTSKDSFLVCRVTIPFSAIREAKLVRGDYNNNFNYSTKSYERLRCANVDDEVIQNAFAMDGNMRPTIPSGLKDVFIRTERDAIRQQVRYTDVAPYRPNETYFSGVPVLAAMYFQMVFEDRDRENAGKFAEYLNYVSSK